MQAILILGILLVLLSFALLKLLTRQNDAVGLVSKRALWIGVSFVCVLFLGAILTFVGYYISPYRMFDEDKPLAVIESTPVEAEIYDTVLSIKHLTFPRSFRPEKFLLVGNQWIIDGDIIKVGLNKKQINLFRLSRVRSRFTNPVSEGQFPELSYNLSGRPDKLLGFLNKHKFAFLDIRPAKASYDSGDEKTEFYLYVTDGKFSLKKK
ncbi:MAG: hypothetical protein Q8L26_08890 [Candidatus Omnitrophota bacterium]|nr:hypothetical protein [Candidatus Omnitrophota bacterium]